MFCRDDGGAATRNHRAFLFVLLDASCKSLFIEAINAFSFEGKVREVLTIFNSFIIYAQSPKGWGGRW